MARVKKPVHHVQMTEGKRALMDIYGFEASESFIDAIHYSVRDNGIIRKMAAYITLGIKSDGIKDVLSIDIGENESVKFWLSSLNNLKNRGVKDVLIICADGLTGIKEAISATFPQTEYQHTTNAIESLNATYRRLNSQRSVFPSDQALLKDLYLVTFDVTKKWSMPIRNWGKVHGELSIMYDGRV